MNKYQKFEEKLNSRVDVPFEMFYSKLIEKHRFDIDRHECFMTWIHLNGYYRDAIFSALSSSFFTPFIYPGDLNIYLKSFTND